MKMIKTILKILVLMTSCLITNNSYVAAQNSGNNCFDQLGKTYESTVILNKGEYDIYVKSDKDVQQSASKVFIRDFEGNICDDLGPTETGNKTWSKVGNIVIDGDKTIRSFALQVSKNKSGNDGHSPTILLNPLVGSICPNPNNCTINFDKKSFQPQPQKISLNSDNLKVGLYAGFDLSNEIKEVVYSMDGKPEYIKKEILDFDTRYITPGNHVLGTTVVFKDLQVLSRLENFEQGVSAKSYLYPIIYGHKNVLNLLCLIFLIITLALGLFFIFRKKDKKIVWRESHIMTRFRQKIETEEQKDKRMRAAKTEQGTTKNKKIAAVIATSFVLLFLAIGYIVGVIFVKGVGMQPSIKESAIRGLFKFPVLLSKITGDIYVPSRGQMIVLKIDENNLFDETFATQENYFVKRVIGLPGDRVMIKDGQVKIINHDFPKGFNPDENVSWGGAIKPTDSRYIDITLKDDEIFIAGDNREQSVDSRLYGPIKVNTVAGRVF